LKKKKKTRLEAAGWKVGLATGLLGLSEAEYDSSNEQIAEYASAQKGSDADLDPSLERAAVRHLRRLPPPPPVVLRRTSPESH
jgi:hypothetical protein